jgi:hypothetical protein
MKQHRYHPRVYGRGDSTFLSSTSSGEVCEGIRSFSFRTEHFAARDGKPYGVYGELEFTDYTITNRSSYPRYYQVKSTRPMVFHRISKTKAEVLVFDGTISGMGTEGQSYQLFARILLPVRYSLDFDRLTPEDPVMRGCARFLDGEVSYDNSKFYIPFRERRARDRNICECAEPWMRLKAH